MKKSAVILIVCLSVLAVLAVIGFSVYRQYFGVEVEISEEKSRKLFEATDALPSAEQAGCVSVLYAGGAYGVYNATELSDKIQGLFDEEKGNNAVRLAERAALGIVESSYTSEISGTKVVGKSTQSVFVRLSDEGLALLSEIGTYTEGTLIIKYSGDAVSSYTLETENPATGDSFTCSVGEINYATELNGEDIKYVYEQDLTSGESA